MSIATSHRAPQRILSAALALLAATAEARAQREVDALWNDPVFKRQFVAGYGFNAEIEPRVTPDEVKILEQVRPLMADDLPKAEATLAKLLKPDGSAILDFTLAGIQFQQDKLGPARANYEKAVAKFPSFRRAWRNLGLIHARNAEYDRAIAAFTRMIELGGGDAYSYGLLGFAHASKQDFQPAEAAYRTALLLQPENSEWRLGLTRCVFKQEKFEDAAALLDVLIARYPDKADFWLLQAHTFIGRKQPLRAAENLEAMERLGQSTPESLYTLGDIYSNERLPVLALRAYKRAIDASTGAALDRPLRAAEVLAARGAADQARLLTAHIHQAMDGQLREDERRKLLKLEARLSMAAGDGSPAVVAILEEVVRLDPLDGEALLLLGQHHARNGQPERAIFYYERAASLAEHEVPALVRHAQVLVGLGRYAEALPLLRRAQELKPREDVARYVEQVERITRTRR